MCVCSRILFFLGRRLEEEGVEDNGLEDESGDGQVLRTNVGYQMPRKTSTSEPQQLLYMWLFFFFLQEDIDASLDNLQDIDMMDISVLDEAVIDNSSGVDCREDSSADSRLDSLFDSKESADAERRGLPEQLTGGALANMEAALSLTDMPEESREIPVAMVCTFFGSRYIRHPYKRFIFYFFVFFLPPSLK